MLCCHSCGIHVKDKFPMSRMSDIKRYVDLHAKSLCVHGILPTVDYYTKCWPVALCRGGPRYMDVCHTLIP